MTTASSPKEISALFADDHDEFTTIIGKPSNDDMHRLCQRNFAYLQDINLGGGTDATGLILYKDDHKAANGNQVFNRANRALKAYDPSIQDDENNAFHLRKEKTWSCKIDRQAAIRTAKRVGNKLVLYHVEETWVVRLKNETTLFKHVTL